MSAGDDKVRIDRHGEVGPEDLLVITAAGDDDGPVDLELPPEEMAGRADACRMLAYRSALGDAGVRGELLAGLCLAYQPWVAPWRRGDGQS